jgi:hypothetical protein
MTITTPGAGGAARPPFLLVHPLLHAFQRAHGLHGRHGVVGRIPHPIMHGVGMPADDVPAARTAMARDIADALQAARGGMAS